MQLGDGGVQCTRSNTDWVGTTPVGEVECWPSVDGMLTPSEHYK
jgi:hypothetical protein